MRPVLLIDVVGLTKRQIGAATPAIAALAESGACAPMTATLPAVTCTGQATMLTGTEPSEHGVVGNGWYDRGSSEIAFWRQSNALVAGEKLYERAKRADPSFTCAKLFWWFNQGARVDWSLTPKPFYPADGRKIFAVYSTPPGLAEETESDLGPFPFFQFWGPKSGLASSRWITRAAARLVKAEEPTLTLVYLPHLDYSHQRFGPEDERSRKALTEVDDLVGELAEEAERIGAETVVVSEYGIEPVSKPVYPNRALRKRGFLAVREGPIGDLLDTFESRAFAVCDHQVAHVHVRDSADVPAVRELVESLDGVASVHAGDERAAIGLDHERAGDLVAIADEGAWFAYYHWLDDARAPDYARTVDIHRKPGYDPCELFVDPGIRFPSLRILRRLGQKAIGMRYLMDIIPLDATLVKGSHGRAPDRPEDGPVFVSSAPFGACGGVPERGVVAMTSVADRVEALLARS